MSKLISVLSLALVFLAAPLAARAADDWLVASAPAKNKASQILASPRVFIVEICAEPGNSGPLLLSSEDNPNKPGIAYIQILPGECVVISASDIFVSLNTDDADKPRGYLKYRLRD